MGRRLTRRKSTPRRDRRRRPETRIRWHEDDRAWLIALERRCRTGDLKRYGSVGALARSLLFHWGATSQTTGAGMTPVNGTANYPMFSPAAVMHLRALATDSSTPKE